MGRIDEFLQLFRLPKRGIRPCVNIGFNDDNDDASLFSMHLPFLLFQSP